jgi:hypothetical protein
MLLAHCLYVIVCSYACVCMFVMNTQSVLYVCLYLPPVYPTYDVLSFLSPHFYWLQCVFTTSPHEHAHVHTLFHAWWLCIYAGVRVVGQPRPPLSSQQKIIPYVQYTCILYYNHVSRQHILLCILFILHHAPYALHPTSCTTQAAACMSFSASCSFAYVLYHNIPCIHSLHHSIKPFVSHCTWYLYPVHCYQLRINIIWMDCTTTAFMNIPCYCCVAVM